jgi:hypothetical protein
MSVANLEKNRTEYLAIKEDALKLTAGLTYAQFNWRPSPKEWSIEECLSHLILTGNFMLKQIEPAVEAANARGLTAPGPFPFSAFDKFALKQTEPPAGRKFPAAKKLRPLHDQPATAVVPSFLHLQDQVMLWIERSAGLNLSRIKIKSPFPVLKFTLGGAFAQIASHERRHLEQAWRVRKALPAA